MKKILRNFLPNSAVNILRHFPSAVLANIMHGFPSKKIKFIGVTGTDGKTTTTDMIYQILKNAGKKVAMVSTINAEIDGEKTDTGFHVTNPDPFLLQKLISKSVTANTEIFVLEVTSHGLDQYRDWGINFEVGVITNITHEHLDYHGTWENYFKSKAKLIMNSNISIINRDEKHYEKLSLLAKNQVVSFGLHKNADFNPSKFQLNLKIPGEYNLLNALAASAACVKLGIDSKIVKSSLSNFQNLVGRMEEIENNLRIKIVVDFAHTPNALENALKALRDQTKEKLISVFGCAGLRDIKKRSLMGEISARDADITIITAEDPRGMIDQINKQILEGVEKSGGRLGENVLIENDRQKAIKLAIKLAKPGDCIGIFGKGHEKSMNITGKKETPWSDQEAVRKVLNEGKN